MIIHIVLLLHLLGFASLFSGLVSQFNVQPKLINGWILGGSLGQLATGLLLTVLHEPQVNHAKIALKLGIVIALVVLSFRYQASKIPEKSFKVMLALTLVNAAVAVLWSTD